MGVLCLGKKIVSEVVLIFCELFFLVNIETSIDFSCMFTYFSKNFRRKGACEWLKRCTLMLMNVLDAVHV
jgi:hypothetical protein